MEKFFTNSSQVKDNNIHIDGEDSKHIIKVLRKRIGENIYITVDQSKTYICKIESFDNDIVKCNIVEEIQENMETDINITLFQCIAKYEKMDDIIQKATQLGVRNVYPVISNRVVVKLDEKTSQKKVERWAKIALEASKQCKRTVIPNIENVISLINICNLASKYDIILLAYENDTNSLKNILKTCKEKEVKNIGVIIGAEGGFDEKEVEELLKCDNIYSVSLGNRILRTETASIFLISNILYEFDEI